MRLLSSIVISILIHGLVAVALIACLEYAPQPDVLATLDLSSVELSFSEQEQETQPDATVPEILQQEVRPSVAELPPETKPEKMLPPDLADPKFPEPKEETSKLPNIQTSKPLQPAPRQARLDAPPKPKHDIRPEYPKGARQRGEQGDVILGICINAAGAVDDVKVAVSSGFPELDEAAVKAARAAKFSPARRGRETVASVARLKLQFKLN